MGRDPPVPADRPCRIRGRDRRGGVLAQRPGTVDRAQCGDKRRDQLALTIRAPTPASVGPILGLYRW